MLYVLSGLLLVFIGIDAWISGKPIIQDWRTGYGATIPMGHFVFIIIGSIFIVFGLFYKPKKLQLMKCPKCKKVFENREIEFICPVCNIKTEAIKGYFERHPEDKFEK